MHVSSNHTIAVLRTRGDINLATYASLEALLEQQMYALCASAGGRTETLDAIVERVRKQIAHDWPGEQAPGIPASCRWIPECYVDEITPPPRSSPSDWVLRLPGDAYALAPVDEEDASALRILREGDVVKFAWIENHGEAIFCVDENRKWTVDVEPPSDVTHVCAVGDPESVAVGEARSALEEFAKQWIENDPDPGQQVMIRYYTWSRTPVSFIFDAGAFRPPAASVEEGDG